MEEQAEIKKRPQVRLGPADLVTFALEVAAAA
jgi:hypothetical protein